jgi:hypothetical protein
MAVTLYVSRQLRDDRSPASPASHENTHGSRVSTLDPASSLPQHRVLKTTAQKMTRKFFVGGNWKCVSHLLLSPIRTKSLETFPVVVKVNISHDINYFSTLMTAEWYGRRSEENLLHAQ